MAEHAVPLSKTRPLNSQVEYVEAMRIGLGFGRRSVPI